MNAYGHFVQEKEFKITNPKTPRPQLNYIWNSRVLSGVNQNGGGVGAYGQRAMAYIDAKYFVTKPSALHLKELWAGLKTCYDFVVEQKLTK